MQIVGGPKGFKYLGGVPGGQRFYGIPSVPPTDEILNVRLETIGKIAAPLKKISYGSKA